MATKIDVEVIDRQCLTPREMQVAALVAEGMMDKCIASALAISLKTLGNHLDHIYVKLQVRQHSVNKRCAALSAMIARGMIRVSVNMLCVWLMVAAASLDDQAARVGRTRLSRVQVVRVRSRERES